MNDTTAARAVYVVDDDDAMRDSLRWLLESAGYRVASFSCAERFLGALRPGDASCLVLDVRMPGLTGLELQQELNRRGVSVPIIFITGHGDVPMAVDALKNGAFHFLEKPFQGERLLELIEQASTQRTPAETERAQRRCAAARLATLTQREREVMDLVVLGRKNKQIAEALGISVKTVEAHRARAMEKMDVTSVAELVQATLSGKNAA
ncbi:MAG TPA: response regulator [Burkholderiales bacterium]|nr:response regulator [Burkholderiales bacterium]